MIVQLINNITLLDVENHQFPTLIISTPANFEICTCGQYFPIATYTVQSVRPLDVACQSLRSFGKRN